MRRTTVIGMALVGIALASTLAPVAGAGSHAFLDRAVPAVGSTVHGSPGEVKVWFTEALEAAFSSLRVVDQNGAQVDRQNNAICSTLCSAARITPRSCRRSAVLRFCSRCRGRPGGLPAPAPKRQGSLRVF